jgi:hypothetical protein
MDRGNIPTLGLTSESLGQTEEALSFYREAVRLEQSTAAGPQAETLLPGASLLLLPGRLDDGERWIRMALRDSPKLRDAHFEYARLLLKKGDAAHSAEEGETALGLSEGGITDTQIRYLLIRAWAARWNAGSGGAACGGVARYGDAETTIVRESVSGRNDSCVLDHEDHGSFRRARAVHHLLRNDEPLSGCKFDDPVGKVDQQFSFQHVKELIVFLVLVPVILSLEDAKTNDRIVHLAKSLVVPLEIAGVSERFLVDHFSLAEKDVQTRLVRIGFGIAHRNLRFSPGCLFRFYS